MTGSHGLPQDASALVRAEDVVRWRDGPGPGGIGIVTQVYGQSDDEALSEDEEVLLAPASAGWRRLGAGAAECDCDLTPPARSSSFPARRA